MILAKVVVLTIYSLSLDLSHRLSQPWGGVMCYWDIIQRSLQGYSRSKWKDHINIHIFAFLSSFSPADKYAYYGLDPFPEYNYFFRADY